MSFPDKASREKCWHHRDLFWECLNSNESNAQEKNACNELRAMYVAACPSQWGFIALVHNRSNNQLHALQSQQAVHLSIYMDEVKHFDRRREYLKFKAKIENDGYEPVAELK